jgi:UPF0755 protein
MKKFLIFLLVLIALVVALVIGGMSYYKNAIGPVSDSNEIVVFEVKKGSTYYTIGSELKEKGLIKDENIYKIYLKINKPDGLKVGDYNLSPNMDLDTIVKTLQGRGNSHDITITFKEGKNMRWIAKNIASNTNNKEEDVYNLLKDKAYLQELITNYWFIDESILNTGLYYPLEGYLYPETYNFKSKDVTVKEIFKTMLDHTGTKIEPIKSKIIASKYNYHQISTLASVIELEALNESDRKMVSSVFYNRLKRGMSLGSDVTTYYGSKVDMSERDLYIQEINALNGYNTRPASMAGKLPIGPICNPSYSSIEAALEPDTSDYLFFVSDNKGKVYFTKTNAEHEAMIAKLKAQGLWERY